MRKKLLELNTIGVLAVALVLFMVAGHAEEHRSDPLADMVTLESRGIGGLRDVVQTSEGTLLIGSTYDKPGGWVVFLNRYGKEVWSFAEGDCWYLHPTALLGGGFAVVREDADDLLSMVVFDENGQVTADRPIPPNTRDILSVGDSLFALGNLTTRIEESGDVAEDFPYLARLSSGAELLWSLVYPHDYANKEFKKAVYAMDSLIIAGDAEFDEPGTSVGLLHRVDLDGNVLWYDVFTPELGDESHVVDVCANGGLIAVIVSDYGYNDDYGYNTDRLCGVYGLNMNGDVLWQHTFNGGEFLTDRILDGVMADTILPVKGGFLCAGYRIAREDSGILPIEWVLLLDREGNVIAGGGTPDIRDDRLEVEGITIGADGKALLYGVNIEGVEIHEEWEEGDIPGKPFYVALDFPEAYGQSPVTKPETAGKPADWANR